MDKNEKIELLVKKITIQYKMDTFIEYDETQRPMLESAYNVISRNEMWEFLKTYSPPEDKGFMYDDNATIVNIMNNINNEYPYHSSVSIACVMRIMKKIAKEKM